MKSLFVHPSVRSTNIHPICFKNGRLITDCLRKFGLSLKLEIHSLSFWTATELLNYLHVTHSRDSYISVSKSWVTLTLDGHCSSKRKLRWLRQREKSGLPYLLITFSLGCPICLRSAPQLFRFWMASLAIPMKYSASLGFPPCNTQTQGGVQIQKTEWAHLEYRCLLSLLCFRLNYFHLEVPKNVKTSEKQLLQPTEEDDLWQGQSGCDSLPI